MKWTIAFLAYQGAAIIASACIPILGPYWFHLLVVPHMVTILVVLYLYFVKRWPRWMSFSGPITIFETMKRPSWRESVKRPWVWIPYTPPAGDLTVEDARRMARELMQVVAACIAAFAVLGGRAIFDFVWRFLLNPGGGVS
ncbi:MAG: hypothetical protein ACYTAN_13855 [Planctomycetota bacterium]|jgi:hypothetical protein